MKFVFKLFPTLRLINFLHIHPYHLPAVPLWQLSSGNVLQEHNNNIKSLFRTVTNPAWQPAACTIVFHIKTNLLIFSGYQCFEFLWTFWLKYLFNKFGNTTVSVTFQSFLSFCEHSLHPHALHSFNSSYLFCISMQLCSSSLLCYFSFFYLFLFVFFSFYLDLVNFIFICFLLCFFL